MLILLLGAALQSGGCAATGLVWRYGACYSVFGELEDVRVSEEGDVCVVYACRTRRTGRQTVELAGFRRYVVLDARAIEARTVPEEEDGVWRVDVREDELRPRNATRAAFDPEALEDVTWPWDELEFLVLSSEPASEERLANRLGRATGRAEGLTGRVRIPYSEGQTLLLSVPMQSGVSPVSVPVRVVLTPLAAVVDLVTSPFQFVHGLRRGEPARRTD